MVTAVQGKINKYIFVYFFLKGRIIAPKKTQVIQQQKLKKVSSLSEAAVELSFITDLRVMYCMKAMMT